MEITTTDLGLAARVQHLTKTYGSGEGTVHALDDVSVGIRRGQFTAIMGPSPVSYTHLTLPTNREV